MFAGNSTTEPIILAAKFTNISSEIILDSQNNLEFESIITDDELDIISKSNNDTTIISNNVTLVVSKIDSTFGFDLGLVIGITIGVTIGISLLLIIRKKYVQ